MMSAEQSMEWELVVETEVLTTKPTLVPLCPSQIPYDLTWASNPVRRGGKPATNRLSYGTALWLPWMSIEAHSSWYPLYVMFSTLQSTSISLLHIFSSSLCSQCEFLPHWDIKVLIIWVSETDTVMWHSPVFRFTAWRREDIRFWTE
jgi:hypothetical protein